MDGVFPSALDKGLVDSYRLKNMYSFGKYSQRFQLMDRRLGTSYAFDRVAVRDSRWPERDTEVGDFWNLGEGLPCKYKGVGTRFFRFPVLRSFLSWCSRSFRSL